jgi:hypothetical protein
MNSQELLCLKAWHSRFLLHGIPLRLDLYHPSPQRSTDKALSAAQHEISRKATGRVHHGIGPNQRRLVFAEARIFGNAAHSSRRAVSA